MKWKTEDIEMYEKAKEYVDTIILPLFPIALDEEMKKSAEMTEFITLLSLQLENKFKGRVVLLPGFSYLKSTAADKRINELLTWDQEINQRGFKYVFYLTSDSDWKMYEDVFDGTLLWFPTIPLQQMDPQYRNTILEDHVNQIFSLFSKKWQNFE